LQNASDLEIIPTEYKDPKEFKDAFDIATQTTWNKKELEVYEYVSLKEFDEINALKTAKEKGMAKGLEQGLAKGIEKGIEKGIKAEKINVAKGLLLAGVDVNIIKNTTELSEKDLMSLKDSL
jgi:predicted transposase/invertase (TIGR01784 family)